MEKMGEDGFSLEDDFSSDHTEEKDVTEEGIDLDEEFSTEDGLSFSYPSDWQKIEDEEMIRLLNESDYRQRTFEEHMEDQNISPDDLNQEEIKTELEEQEEIKSELEGEVVFMATKTLFPNISLGIMTVQRINDLDGYSPEEAEERLKKVLEIEGEDEEIIITHSEKGEGYVLIETESRSENNPLFKTKTVGFTGENFYLFSFSSSYETWSDFRNEFNRIISEIEYENR